jgi:class 3 adenylate cyclase
MPRIPIFKLGSAPEGPPPPELASYLPSMSLEGLQLGVDNLRHDVHLSARFVEKARLQIARLIARHGNVDGLLAAEAPEAGKGNHFIGSGPVMGRSKTKTEPADLKPLLVDLHVAALNRAKNENNLALDQLARLAVLKFLRVELSAQFAQMLERCRVMLKSYEGLRQQKAMEYREQVAAFQVAKRIILRKVGQELFRTLREIEKETLARTRRSLFGDGQEASYQLFLNPLIFSEDGRDPYLNAEHYVMLGNFDRDSDRFSNLRRVACEFLQSLDLGPGAKDETTLDGWLNVPENAQELVGGGSPDESTPEGRGQESRLQMWLETLEAEEIMNNVIASYEVVPLLSEYSPRIHAQQLKNALISREERGRLEKLIEEHGKLSPGSFYSAMSRMSNCRGAERARVAGRFLRDFMRYHRDLRRLETLNGATDSINLIGNEKLRELSAMNGTLYEFLLPDETQKSAEERIVNHVVIKADVRDSTRLTRSLVERGLNPASYFSLNFYDPVNKLLSKYGATKVFLEGDAIILALLEREGEPGLAVGKACVLAREMIELARGYNQLLTKGGLPPLELGIGISFQNSAPLYLKDGEQRIMISDALNESDRLSSCNKRVRKPFEKLKSPFAVYAFQIVSDADAGESTDDFILNYNLAGIRMSAAAFAKLQKEISLELCEQNKLPELWGSEKFRLYRGQVPLGNGIFRSLVIRESRMAQVEARTFSLQKWTDRLFYEICSDTAVYEVVEGKKAAAGK